MTLILHDHALATTDPAVRPCLSDYLQHLQNTLPHTLAEVRMLDSDTPPEQRTRRAQRAALDLAVITDVPLTDNIRQMLFDDGRTFFLRCSQQVSPSFWTLASYHHPGSARAAAFVERLKQDGVLLVSRTES